ncbi:MAG TPA: ABC transporter permease [Clostridiaceae bacterium]|nr:ABC transporter permease [Clostridiaceae bacterium]
MNKQAVKIGNFLLKEKVFSSSVLLLIAISIASPYFLSVDNLRNLAVQIAVYGIVGLGMTFAIIGGEFDLAAGSMISISGVLAVGLEPKIGLGPALVVAMLSGLVFGCINGLLISKAGINSFIVTFGSMVTVKGLALTIANGRPITSQSEALNNFGDLRVIGIPVMFLIFVILLVVCHYILTYTRFGRNIYAVGGNLDVAKATGLNVAFYKAILFILTGLFSALVGILLAARLNTGSPIQGDDITLTVIASVVIGGTSLSGGKGNTARTLLGVFIMMLLSNSFDLLGIQPYIQKVIKGLIIISVVAFDSYNKKRIER